MNHQHLIVSTGIFVLSAVPVVLLGLARRGTGGSAGHEQRNARRSDAAGGAGPPGSAPDARVLHSLRRQLAAHAERSAQLARQVIEGQRELARARAELEALRAQLLTGSGGQGVRESNRPYGQAGAGS